MYVDEFLEYLSKTDEYRKRTYSREEIEEMVNTDTREMAENIKMLFCYEKAMHDPSPKVQDLQRRMRKKENLTKEDEAFIANVSATIQMSEFKLAFSVQDGIKDALYQLDHHGNDRQPIEWWYELNNM